MRQHWFTPRSARRALAALRPVAERLFRLYRELETRRPRHIGCDQRVDPSYFRLARQLQASLHELGRHGVRVDDPARGSIAFPARREGRAVLLCWRVGEAAPSHWLEVAADERPRRPVDEDGPWDEPPVTEGDSGAVLD